MPEAPTPKHVARPLPNGWTGILGYRGKHRRRAAWIALLATISLVTGVTSSVLFAHISEAGAGTAASSTFTKTGRDASTGSTATVGKPGTAHPGDVLNWAMSYDNTSGQLAHLHVTDPIVGQNYQLNSLRTPPGISGTFDPSTNTITASGDVSAGTTAAESGPFPVATTNFSTPGGDGFTVEGYGSNIFLAGDSCSFNGGWVEGAIQTALNAVCGVIRSTGGTFDTALNPVDNMSANSYLYTTTVPEPEPVG